MSTQKKETITLEDQLQEIAKNGITADRAKLKKDMCTQFANHREYIRELVCNSYDANANLVTIEGSQDDNIITIRVQDNGDGMNKQGIINYTTVYRSDKTSSNRKAVGRHGVGKLSVAAIPSLKNYYIRTSTGKEAWYFNTESLIDDKPIDIYPDTNIGDAGTFIEIKFESNQALEDELNELKTVLQKFISFLPISVRIKNLNDYKTRPWLLYTRDWSLPATQHGRRFVFETHDGNHYDAVIDLNSTSSSIYQNGVYIFDTDNIFSTDLTSKFNVPHITVRVDSPDFELTFGRHCLQDNTVLENLSRYLRTNVLKEYVYDCYRQYSGIKTQSNISIDTYKFEELATRLLKHDAAQFPFLKDAPLFIDATGIRYSLNQLNKIIEQVGRIYVSDAKAEGVDYNNFDAPVLLQQQPGDGRQILEQVFDGKMINLSTEDVVFEAPHSPELKIGERELNFQNHIGFSADSVELMDNDEDCNDDNPGWGIINSEPKPDDVDKAMAICEEAKEAKYALEKVAWRVNYLVQRDGITANTSHRFIIKNLDVVLNLNHPEIKNLLIISEQFPGLAGHWGLALCLTDNSNALLSHLSSKGKEDLILADAVAKSIGHTRSGDEDDEDYDNEFLDILRYGFNGF